MTWPTGEQLVPQLEARLGLRLGALKGADAARASAALGEAVALVAVEVGPVAAAADPAPAVALAVALSAARRAYLNPSGVLSETVGPTTVRWADDSPSGVYLTAAERRTLSTLRRGGRSGLGTITTTRDGDELPTFYVRDQWTPYSDPIPWEDAAGPFG